MSARHEYPGTIANQTYHIRFDRTNALFIFRKKKTPDVIFPVLQRLTHIKIKMVVTGMLIFG